MPKSYEPNEVTATVGTDAPETIKVHLLDVGPEEYGDAILCQFGARTVLIDGAHPGNHSPAAGHPSIPEQIGELLNQQPPYRLSLLIISHAHQDHIGCLPRLVRDGVIEFEWALVTDPGFGWGRAEGEDGDRLITDNRQRQLVAALREEIRSEQTDNRELARFLADAATLEDNYNAMLETLAENGTRVIRHGRNSHQGLVNQFSDIGLRIIGPSRNHLLECADLINRTQHDSIAIASNLLGNDAVPDPLGAYRQWALAARANLDALDVSRPGPAVNLQSTVICFKYQGHKFLFAGDMQFEQPQVNNTSIEQSVRRLRQQVKQEAPFSFVKLSHHGSFNAFSETILNELGATNLFGICAGAGSTHHPNRSVLEVLDEHSANIKWARTDHNGQVTLSFGPGQPKITLTEGEINDAQPNSEDVTIPSKPQPQQPPIATGESSLPPVSRPSAPSVPPSQSAPAVTQIATPEVVEVTARIPHTATRVTITVDVAPQAKAPSPEVLPDPSRRLPALAIAGGRQLPQLLFVTNREALAGNIGRLECEHLLDALRARGLLLIDQIPAGVTDAVATAAMVGQVLAQQANVQGVVLIGGYDVMPAERRDCLPSDLRRELPPNDDPDNFIVWSDDLYGQPGADGLPRLPVSRIPDGKSGELVRQALQAGSRSVGSARAGVRNVARPFADGVYSALPGTANLLVSQPATFDQHPALNLQADHLYFMLHGDYVDATRFWGERTAGYKEAVNIANVPTQCGRVVFAGCCWGALPVDTPAGLIAPHRPFGQKTAESSIALSFLAHGASAFVGCTGAHYSPTEPPFQYFGGPLHTAFWQACQEGATPAQALLMAKTVYQRGIPHGRPGPVNRAIELKILRQYTCLGLGW